MTVPKCIIDMMRLEICKNNLRTTEAQIVQKLKNNEARPKFTGSYIKKASPKVNLFYSWKNKYFARCRFS